MATVTSLAILRKGMTPWLSTLVALMGLPVALMFVQSLPMPPDHFDSWALSP